jgi:hypothetical protein
VEAYYENESSPIARGIAAGIFHFAFWRALPPTQTRKNFYVLAHSMAGVPE